MHAGPAVGYNARTMSKPKHKPPQTSGQLQAMAKRIAKRHGLRREQARLLAALAAYAHRADLDDDDGLVPVWPSNDHLATRLGVTTRSIQRRLAGLEARGLIRRPQAPQGGHHGKRYGRRDGGGNLAFANGILLDLHAWRRPPKHTTVLHDTSGAKCRVEVSCRTGESVTHNPPEVSCKSVVCIEPDNEPDNEPNIEPPRCGAREGVAEGPGDGASRVDVEALTPDQQADMFMAHYPPTAGSAYLARKAFMRAVANGADARSILKAAWQLRQAVEANPDEARYIPYPANWIDAQGWADVQALVARIGNDANGYDAARPQGPDQIGG